MASQRNETYSGYLTPLAADGGAIVRAEALANARVHRALLLDPPQLKPVR